VMSSSSNRAPFSLCLPKPAIRGQLRNLGRERRGVSKLGSH
jgi:hypothetical protein